MQLVNLIPHQYARSNGWDGECEEQLSQVAAEVSGLTLCSEAVGVVVSQYQFDHTLISTL